MFKTIKLEGDWWAVFLVSGQDDKDRYMLTSPLKEHEARHFEKEFYRLAESFY